MKNVIIIGIIFFYIILASCDRIMCEDVESWIDEAPKALDDYLEVEKEFLNDTIFLNEFSYQKTNLFLKVSDTSNYFIYDLPELKKWFRNGRGYISITPDHISFCYKECSRFNQMSVNGYIYNNDNKIGNYKSQVNIIDSLYMKDEWFAHIITCKGCDD